MAYHIYTTYSLSQIQTILALILSVLGIGWFILLSNVVKVRALRLLSSQTTDNKNYYELPILESIIPTTITDALRMLKIKMMKPVVFISAMVILGLIFTSFEGIIVINTVRYIESCKTSIVKSQAQITNNNHTSASYTSSEDEEMMRKRNKSGVP